MHKALSPLDGRYRSKVEPLATYFSEEALMRYRLMVEVEYFIALGDEKGIKEVSKLSVGNQNLLRDLVKRFDEKEAQKIKIIEGRTNHDVKAIEYYLKEKFAKSPLKNQSEFIHFGLTSEDVNNLSYALMTKEAMGYVLLPKLNEMNKKIVQLSKKWKTIPLLSLTHGQPATPTTVGKELANAAYRLKRQSDQLKKQDYLGKLNGATGNYSAQLVAYPKVNWPAFSAKLIKKLGLKQNPLTAQIEPHDWNAELFDALARTNTILTDLSRDIWGYISRGVFKQKVVAGEIGSSTMPHKVNPIDFENAEGNLGLSNALLRHMAKKLPISRFQRDLTDSTVQRNIGVALGYSLLAYEAMLKGLNKLEVDKARCHQELENNWELLAEPIQTILRKNGVPNAYEKLKELTRGKKVNKKIVQDFIANLPIPQADKQALLKLTPQTYIGLSPKLV